MIYQGIDIWGAEALSEVRGGACPQKMPEEVCSLLSPWAPAHSRLNIGMELRFVPLCEEVTLTLSTKNPEQQNRIFLYHGSMQSGTVFNVTGEETEIKVSLPKNLDALEKVRKNNGLSFSPKVVRLLLSSAPIVIHKIEGALRLPEKGEVPELNGIFYGSSISEGSHGIIPNLLWTRRCADKLGVDSRNYGLAGSCFIEKPSADFFASLNDWDFMVMELGINVVGKMELNEFRDRVRYTLSTVHNAHPDKYIFCIDIFHYGSDNGGYYETVDAFRNVVVEEAAALRSPKVKIIGGETILTSDLGMSSDMVHPSIEGVIEMAENLSRTLRPYIEKYKRNK